MSLAPRKVFWTSSTRGWPISSCKLTVERGFDPRDFVLLSYGGAGPVHAGAYSREVGVARALVSPYSPVFSALGIASSDVVRHYSKSAPMQPPFSADGIEHVFATLERRALDDLGKSDVKTGECALQRFINMRFRYQVHEIRVPVRSGLTLPGAVDRLVEDFVALYERNFGAGTALREAGVEMLTFHVVSAVSTPKPALQKFPRRLRPKPRFERRAACLLEGRLHRDTGILLGTPGAGKSAFRSDGH